MWGRGQVQLVGKVCGVERAMRGGLGSSRMQFPNNLIISAVVIVNTYGDVRSYEDNRIIAGARSTEGGFVDTIQYIMNGNLPATHCRSNTIIGVVATNARFDKTDMTKIAQMAQVGVSHVITPAHTMYDGDTFFALATGDIKAEINFVGIVAAELVKKAIQNAIFQSTARDGIPAYSNCYQRGMNGN